MNTLSLRTRLTLFYTVTLVIVLALFGADVLIALKRLGLRRADAELSDVQATLARIVGEEIGEHDTPDVAAKEAREALGSLDVAIAVFDDHGKAIAWPAEASREDGTGPGPLTLADLTPGGAAPSTRTLDTKSGQWRVMSRPATFGGTTMQLVIGRPLRDIAREQHEVQEAMFVVIPIALLLAGAGGWWLASIGLRPVTEMARRAANIPLTGMEDLGPPPRDDELGQLARAFNGLVARLRAALQTQRQFMADASHELRTPVSVIRTASEVTLSREHRDEPEYREALTMAGAQSRRLSKLVEDMLVLARADAGGYPLQPVDLYIDDVVDQCRRAVDVLAAERGITVASTGPSDIPVRGDEELLRRLMVNLLQNAVQHTRKGGTVSIDVSPNGSHVYVRVKDNGEGIAEGDRDRIFDRFVQLDPSRRAEGTGLGLTIAKWIAEAHDGSLSLESSGPGGSTFCVTLPSAAR